MNDDTNIYFAMSAETTGFEHSGFVITDEEQEPFVAGGFNMSTRDYARLGQMMLQKGEWNGTRIVSEAWIDRMTRKTAPLPDPETAKIPDGQLRYGLQWWLPPAARAGEFFGILGRQRLERDLLLFISYEFVLI